MSELLLYDQTSIPYRIFSSLFLKICRWSTDLYLHNFIRNFCHLDWISNISNNSHKFIHLKWMLNPRRYPRTSWTFIWRLSDLIEIFMQIFWVNKMNFFLLKSSDLLATKQFVQSDWHSNSLLQKLQSKYFLRNI